MRVLVVGGAGYVGGALTDLLYKNPDEHEFRVYDNLLHEECYLKSVPFVFGDVLDTEALKPHLEWADTVIWLAALVGDGICDNNPTLAFRINQEAVKGLKGYKGRVIFTSTCSVYGDQEGILTEKSPTNPLSVYAATKMQAEKYLQDNTDCIIFRYGTLFGQGDTHSRIRMDLVVNTLTANAVNVGKISLYGGGQYRPLLHVKDAANMLYDAIDLTERGVYNLHSVNCTIKEIADEIVELFPDTIVEEFGKSFKDMRNYQVCSDRAVRDLEFLPEYSVRDGILEISSLLLQHRIQDVNNPRYVNANRKVL